jgi:hypothetical protein
VSFRVGLARLISMLFTLSPSDVPKSDVARDMLETYNVSLRFFRLWMSTAPSKSLEADLCILISARLRIIYNCTDQSLYVEEGVQSRLVFGKYRLNKFKNVQRLEL